jgi:CheY-like chemotaxis protein
MEDLKKMPIQVLVVDDEKSMRDILTDYLNEYGYEVTCAVNGQEALEIYKQRPFDII